MWHEAIGSSEQDPLYILLKQEDEAEADAYADTQWEMQHQLNMAAERERGSIDFGDTPFSFDDESVIVDGTDEQAIEMLIKYYKRSKK